MVQAEDLAHLMGALAQGPSVAKGCDFVNTKLVTRKEVAKTENHFKQLSIASTAGPSKASSPALAANSAPKTPLRILKFSPAQFAAIKRARVEGAAATATSSMAKVAKMEEVPAPALALNNNLGPFQFAPFMAMPSQPSIPMFPASSDVGEQGTSTTMTWQACARLFKINL